MTTIELLNEVEKMRCQATNVFDQLLRRGILPIKINTYREIYFAVDADMKINGSSKTVAVENVSENLGVTTQTIWNALKLMKQAD